MAGGCGTAAPSLGLRRSREPRARRCEGRRKPHKPPWRGPLGRHRREKRPQRWHRCSQRGDKVIPRSDAAQSHPDRPCPHRPWDRGANLLLTGATPNSRRLLRAVRPTTKSPREGDEPGSGCCPPRFAWPGDDGIAWTGAAGPVAAAAAQQDPGAVAGVRVVPTQAPAPKSSPCSQQRQTAGKEVLLAHFIARELSHKA